MDKNVKKLGILLLTILILLSSSVFFLLKGSSADLSGCKSLPGLKQAVLVERDCYGIPTIHGESREDVARATGFVHGQERFFQMDLMRRAAAGELSELFGNVAVEFDKERRLHCFRRQAKVILGALTLFEQSLLKAYTEGVNAGLKALTCKPFEYFILQEQLTPWREEDSVLVGLGLFFDLQDPMASVDWVRGTLKRFLSSSVYEFFTQNGSIWEAPLDETSISLLSIPKMDDFQYLKQEEENIAECPIRNNLPPLAKGSNQWAVSPRFTASGRAILACDMHLNLLAPNIWYRLAITYPNQEGKPIEVNGVSLPGTPLIAVGSNRHIVWGFTNAYVDTSDLILLDIDPSNTDCYLTPEGSFPFEEKIEEIKIKGNPSICYKIPWTKWGPVHPKLFFEKQVAIRWIAHDPNCFNFRLIDLELVVSSNDALNSIPNINLPVLNFMVADKEGHIGWSFVGEIPERVGYQPGIPISFTSGANRWIGHIDRKEYPVLTDPANGRLWTANNRVLSHASLGGDYLNAIRAYQIRKRLFYSDQHTLDDMYAMQLDDEAFFFDRWRDLLLANLDSNNLKHSRLLSIIHEWDHHCSAASLGYFWIRTFREMVINRVSERLLSPCLSSDPDLHLNLLDLEEPIYLIVSQQPSYLADSKFGSWKVELAKIIEDLADNNMKYLNKPSPWGNFNMASIQHPLGEALSFVNFLLNMPKKPLSGDYYVPRVASPSDGASVRLVVSPGHEEEGILNVPCGQSGNPLSRHYRDQHGAWMEGKPTPFLPGQPVYHFSLIPAS